ncbi:MAG: hypothetical protein JNK37_08355 [Verrucomicrobiales bacterium]|nr:hypothetical protein [Verrucomicrobiales bacterium]
MKTHPLARRRFLAEIGQATMVATLGPVWAADLGLAPRSPDPGTAEALPGGDLELLVDYLIDTPLDQLQAGLVAKLAGGVSLRRLVAAGALANARVFGGGDYVGFHTFMALAPALHMASLMPRGREALPVLKVLYRNTHRLAETGGRPTTFPPVPPTLPPGESATAEQLRAAVMAGDTARAEQLFAAQVVGDRSAAFDALLRVVEENVEVHRTVLPYRAWSMIDVVGPDHAAVLLRQSLRYCLDAEAQRRPEWEAHGRVLARLLDEHGLPGRPPGTRDASDAWVGELGGTLFTASPEDAAAAVATALADGYRPEVIGEALALAANQIVLRDPGRIPAWEMPGKTVGSVHGDSVGVHASDAVNAWRHLSQVGGGHHGAACLILGAWQVARDRMARGPVLGSAEPVPSARQVGSIQDTAPDRLLAQLGEMIEGRLQSHAAAVVQRYADLGHPERPLFDTLLRFAVSEDGALHAEKYFQTVWDDFHHTRPAYRWRHLLGLARVTASEYGYPAPGQAEARTLVGVK